MGWPVPTAYPSSPPLVPVLRLLVFFFFRIHLSAPWGTWPYVALYKLLVSVLSFSYSQIYHCTLEHLPASDGSGFAIRQVSGIPGHGLRQDEGAKSGSRLGDARVCAARLSLILCCV